MDIYTYRDAKWIRTQHNHTKSHITRSFFFLSPSSRDFQLLYLSSIMLYAEYLIIIRQPEIRTDEFTKRKGQSGNGRGFRRHRLFLPRLED